LVESAAGGAQGCCSSLLMAKCHGCSGQHSLAAAAMQAKNIHRCLCPAHSHPAARPPRNESSTSLARLSPPARQTVAGRVAVVGASLLTNVHLGSCPAVGILLHLPQPPSTPFMASGLGSPATPSSAALISRPASRPLANLSLAGAGTRGCSMKAVHCLAQPSRLARLRTTPASETGAAPGHCQCATSRCSWVVRTSRQSSISLQPLIAAPVWGSSRHSTPFCCAHCATAAFRATVAGVPVSWWLSS